MSNYFCMKKLFLLLAAIAVMAISASAQTQTITGTVLSSADDEPLVGASVMPIGGGQGGSTDVNGNFRISAPASVKQLKVSLRGLHGKDCQRDSEHEDIP